ncbi:hypothetical protein ACLBP1_24710, partial [Klebsiella pneumoniae]
MTNRLELSGIICRTPLRKVSPSGIPHCQFVLEHRSVQEEGPSPPPAPSPCPP